MDNQDIVLPSADGLVEKKTIEVWAIVGKKDQHYYLNEDSARLNAASHIECVQCQTPTLNRYHSKDVVCTDCQDKNSEARYIERFKNAPKAPWDGDSYVYLECCDKWFTSEDELADYLYGERINAAHIRLYHSTPQSLRFLETDYWEGDLPDDGDGELPSSVSDAVDELNKVIEEHGKAVSFIPNYKLAVLLTPEQIKEWDFSKEVSHVE